MLLDCHTHAHFAAFEKDYKEVIKRALDAGVAIINVGTQRDTSKRAVEVCDEFPTGVYAAVGLHPTHTTKSYHDAQELGGGEAAKAFVSRGEIFDFEFYNKLAHHPKVVAIGECGLDYYRLNNESGIMNYELETKEKQKTAFIAQAQLALKHHKALMIHCRPSKGTDDAYEDILSILSSFEYQAIPKVLHFYVGSLEMTKKFIASGFNFTFGGVITFPPKAGKSSGDYDEVIRAIPADRILLETDAPYVAPAPYRGKRNEPVYIIETAKKMAEIKGMEYDKMCEIEVSNAKRIFGITV